LTLLKFAQRNYQFVTFGFLAAFTSSFGQTYFIGVFGPEIQAEFGLTYTDWGTIYLMGTLASAAILPFSGKLIDQVPLRRYTFWTCVLLMMACGSSTFITGNITLIVFIFLLRHAGQGLMSHIAMTSMSRSFFAGRGRAVAIAALGYSLGEALLPLLAVIAIAMLGWRMAYGGVALYLGLIATPIFMMMLTRIGKRWPDEQERSTLSAVKHKHHQRSWSRAEVLRDPRMYLLLPGLLAIPIISTAMFFHHLTLADVKGWSYTWITGSYSLYALSTVITGLLTGQLIDRIGAVRVVPFMLIPLVLAMVVVSVFDNPFTVWVYMILMGFNVGIAHTAVSAMWAELYGVHHLGAIRSFATAISVFGTALGPVTTGILVDLGVGIEQVILLFAVYAFMGTCLLFMALRPSRLSQSK
jgi:MFS family permease